MLAGLPLGDWYPELEDALLALRTEMHDAARDAIAWSTALADGAT